MSRDTVSILSGTRDELGDVTVGVGNIFEREERPGGLSCVLALPDRQVVLVEGDAVDIGTSRYRLLRFDIEPHGRRAVFERINLEGAPSATPRRSLSTIAEERNFQSLALVHPMPAADLARAVRFSTSEALALLGPEIGPVVDWTESRTEQTHREWNGGELGPNTLVRWAANFAAASVSVEASVSLEIVRWSPDDVLREEVFAFWRNGQRTASLSARSQGTGAIGAASVSGLDGEAMATLVAALALLRA